MAKHIMMMGTGSHVGKSILAAAFCRIFCQDGKKVAPFKAQNMALNSFVTADGLEMGRAQVAQAEAAGLAPDVRMNPVLLKPTGNASSQVIVMGKPIGNMSAREYHEGKSLKIFPFVTKALNELDEMYEVLVIEGAGSPAEVNLKANDIVNMRVAKYLRAPVLLVADIERGGALAAIVGTLELLDDDERELVKGIVINKFRGDVSLFASATDFLEKKTGVPVVGILPHLGALGIDDEDSVSLDDTKTGDAGEINIAVVRLPKLANFTDFYSLAAEAGVKLFYAENADELCGADMIIIPGSKNTAEDLLYLRAAGFENTIKKLFASDTPVVGICGGYQMLGEEICDPLHAESETGSVKGLGLLPMRTVFSAAKNTAQTTADCEMIFLGKTIAAKNLSGYEIHMGETEFFSDAHPFCVTSRGGKKCAEREGLCGENVFGTYMHGLFDNDGFRLALINALRSKKNLPPLTNTRNTAAEKEKSYNRLADAVRANLDVDAVRRIMGIASC